MRILISEHFCSGGLAGMPLEAALLDEGAAMLRGLVEDFHAAGVEVVVPLDERLPFALPAELLRVDARSPTHARDAWERGIAAAAAALVVAPEQDGLLAAAIGRVERAGVVNLGSPSAAVSLCSDKHALGRRLSERGLPTAEGHLGLEQAAGMLARWGEVVIKPNRGAGCTDTFICRSAADVAGLPARTDWLVQRRMPGLAASVAIVVPRHGAAIPLRGSVQLVGLAAEAASTGRLAYSGGQLPLAADLEPRAVGLGLAAVAHLPGLHGLVGVDVVLGETPDGDAIIEVNPRPTTAYVALRRLADFSIPALILGRNPPIVWRPGGIRYTTDGRCQPVAGGCG